MRGAGADFEGGQPRQFVVDDAPGQGFGRLLHQRIGGGAEQQELAAALSFPASGVDLSPEHLEQLGHSLHFVQHDQSIRMGGEIARRVGQARSVVGILQVQVQAVRHVGGDVPRERRLADLARPEERDRGRFRKAAEDCVLGVSFNIHPC